MPDTTIVPTHHVLVRNNNNRHKRDGIVRHGWSGRISPGSLRLVSSGVYMSTPEFTFLQLATVLPLTRLALAGCALCASYYINSATDKLVRRKPITSVERIAQFLDGAKGVRGVNVARDALRYVANGAESPQEVNLFLLMALPRELGGRGIEGLKLNYKVEPKECDKKVLDRSDRKWFRIDMGVPELMRGAEYLGKDHMYTVDADRERQNALLALGHVVLQVKYANIADVNACDRLVCQLTRLLEGEEPVYTPAEKIAQAELANELFGVERPQL